MFGQLEVLLMDLVQFFFVHFLEIDKFVSRALRGADQLIEFDLQRFRIAVLRILDEEHHQERDDRRAGIDNELPRVTESENRSGNRPGDNYQSGRDKSYRLTG